MNAVSIIPLGAPHAGQRAKSEHPVAQKPGTRALEAEPQTGPCCVVVDCYARTSERDRAASWL